MHSVSSLLARTLRLLRQDVASHFASELVWVIDGFPAAATVSGVFGVDQAIAAKLGVFVEILPGTPCTRNTDVRRACVCAHACS